MFPVRVIPTGAVSPADKRDIAAQAAKGEILAFLDDDAYPRPDWLTNAVAYFLDDSVAAVGGPAVTPPNDSFLQKASGAVFSSVLVSGAYVYRYLPREARDVEDFPSCNFLVRADVMRLIGGFSTAFWPGEDTKFCHDIVTKTGKRIVYAPDVLVYHHRRTLFRAHLKQVSNYALHRGYFVKKYPRTSLKPAYFAPSLLVTGLIAGAMLSVAVPPFGWLYSSVIAVYLACVLLSAVRNPVPMIPHVVAGIVSTHLAYGIFFIKGLSARRLKDG